MRPIKTLYSTLIVAIHIGCLASFYWHRPAPPFVKKRLVVRTTKLQALIKPVAKKVNKKKTSPPKKKVKAKPKPKPKPKPVKRRKPRPKPQQRAIPQNLLDQLEESIAKIDKNDHKAKSKSSLVVPTLTPKSSRKSRVSEVSFQQRLIECLHRSLSLPDHGEVTIELTLSSNGLVSGLNVLKAESSKNRAYLEKHLPQVIFPPLEGTDLKTEQRKFVLTFYNEI